MIKINIFRIDFRVSFIAILGLFAFTLFSCSDVFYKDTVEQSIRESTVNLTFDASGGEWDSDGATSRVLRGVKGLKIGDSMDIPKRVGYKFTGWVPALPEVFPQYDASFTATWVEDIADVSLDIKRVGVVVGKSIKLTAKLFPPAEVKLEWTSDSEDVATVDENGIVTVKPEATIGGVAIITVTTPDKKSAICQVIAGQDFDVVGAYTESGSEISFGVFPQTVLASTVEIYGEMGDDLFPGSYATMEYAGQTYYLGTDGAWYAKVTANTFAVCKFSNGETVEYDKDYYFKVEPIKWQKLSNGWLLAKEGLAANIPYYSGARRTLGKDMLYGNNYKYSNIRAYLNGTKNQLEIDGGSVGGNDVDWTGKGFIDIAFTETQCQKIKPTSINNSAGEAFSSGTDATEENKKNKYYCDNTTDNIFLLSEHEAASILTSNPARVIKPTDYAKASYAYQSAADSEGGAWMLRSPKPTDEYNILSVKWDGTTNQNDRSYVKYMSIVPALSVEN